jgi:peptide methionine sulfoxide reductase MsrA
LINQLESDKAYGGLPIVTKVIEASDFWKADSSHQNYYNRNKTA